jgi:hypothetical protein
VVLVAVRDGLGRAEGNFGARLWYARQLEVLDLEPAPYLYLGAKLAEVAQTDCEVIDR